MYEYNSLDRFNFYYLFYIFKMKNFFKMLFILLFFLYKKDEILKTEPKLMIFVGIIAWLIIILEIWNLKEVIKFLLK